MAVTSGIAHLADTGKQITAGQRHVFVSEGESPGTSMPAITGELVLGGQR